MMNDYGHILIVDDYPMNRMKSSQLSLIPMLWTRYERWPGMLIFSLNSKLIKFSRARLNHLTNTYPTFIVRLMRWLAIC